MSKVKISGNASGTGTLTISAPNTDTDRSLTLPDTAGEIVTADSNGDVLVNTDNARIGSNVGAVEYGTSTLNSVRFYSNDTERMRITSAGNVGIGTSSPTAPLDISKSGSGMQQIARFSVADAGVHRFNISVDDTNNLVQLASTGTNAGGFTFLTGNTERMRMTSDYFFVDTTDLGTVGSTAGIRLGNQQIITVKSNGIPLYVCRRDGTGTGVSFRYGTTTVGTIVLNSSSTSYNTSSDYRLKENIVDMDGAIDRVKALQPRRFNFIADADTVVDGFIAHEVSDVVPEAISGEKDAVQVWEEDEELPEGVSVGDNKTDEDGNTIPDYQGIDQSKLVPLLTGALQEAIAKIETLETTVADLTTRIEALENA